MIDSNSSKADTMNSSILEISKRNTQQLISGVSLKYAVTYAVKSVCVVCTHLNI
jgi:hypothetical protein